MERGFGIGRGREFGIGRGGGPGASKSCKLFFSPKI